MFKVTRKNYIAALESTEEMEKVLIQESENLKASSNNLKKNWWGMQAEKSLENMYISLETADHAKAMAYTQGMICIMGEYLPEIEKLMAKREQIGQQLKQDNYVSPDLSDFREEQLIINYDFIDDIKADTEGAVLYGDRAIRLLEEMIEEAEQCAGDYVNLGRVKEMVEEGEKKLHRLENYSDEFVDFAKKMKELEYNMSMDLKNIMNSQGDSVTDDSAGKNSENSLNNHIKTMEKSTSYTMSENMDISLKRQTKFMNASVILRKDIQEITEEEKFNLSDTFVDIYTIFKNKVDGALEQAAETLNDYAKSFYQFQRTVTGEIQNIVTTNYFEIVKDGITEEYEELQAFLCELEKVPGENIKETINNLDELAGGQLKAGIYSVMTFCAENGIEDITNATYEIIFPQWYRPIQKAAINSGYVKLPSAFEGWLINDLFVEITKGLLGFNYDETTGTYYTTEGSLQNAWGFGTSIDEFAPLLGMDLYHKEFVFTVDDKEYLLELWKGEYGWGITSGGEVGIYTRPIEEAYANPREEDGENFEIFYDCAEGDDRLHTITTMYDMSGEEPREICTRDTADYTEDGLDYWNLNFKSWDAVDKEDIKMEAVIEGDVEIIQGIMEYYETHLDEMENIKIEVDENVENKITIIWEEGE